MASGGMRLALAILVAAAFGAGCGDGKDVAIDLSSTPTPGAIRTATPAGSTPVRTATPVATATPAGTTTGGAPTATPTPGAVDSSVETTVGDFLPFFTIAGLTRGVGSAAAAATNVDNCPDGGTRTEDDQLTGVTVTLAACKFSDPDLGSFQFDGTITASLLSQTAAFNVTTLDLNHNHTVTFVGSVTGTPTGSGGFVVNGGPIVLTTPEGKFTIHLQNLTVDGTGNVVSGGGNITDDDDNFDLQSIQITIQSGGATADLLATFDDSTTKAYVLDLKKGSITPAS